MKRKTGSKKIAREETNFTNEEKFVIDYLNKTNNISPL